MPECGVSLNMIPCENALSDEIMKYLLDISLQLAHCVMSSRATFPFKAAWITSPQNAHVLVIFIIINPV